MPDRALHDDHRDRDARVLGGRDADEPLVAAVGVVAREAPGLPGDAHAGGAAARPSRGWNARRAVPRTVVSTIMSRSCAASAGESTRRGGAGSGSGSSRPLPSTTRAIQRGVGELAVGQRGGQPRRVERRDAAAREAAAEPAERVAVVARGRRGAGRVRRAPAPRGSRSGGSRRACASAPSSCTASCAKHWLFDVASALRSDTSVPRAAG